MENISNLHYDLEILENLERQVTNLSKLVEINSIINSTLDIGRLLSIIMEIIKDIMNTEASTLLLFDEESEDLVFKVALGEAGSELQEKYRVKLGQGVAGWVAENRKAVFVNEVYKDRRFDPAYDLSTGFVTKAIICAPLLFKGKMLGVIQAINPVNRPAFVEDDLHLFKSFAVQAALAVQNAIAFHKAIEEERISNELDAAQIIQNSLVPEITLNLDDILVAAKSMPAREVGGEFYEFTQHPDSLITMSMADVHQKGVPGAMCASVLSGALKGMSDRLIQQPVSMVSKLNKIVQEKFPSVEQASFFYGMILPDRKTFQFVNAGVIYPILLRDNKARYLKFAAKPLGSVDELKVKLVTLKLQHGDMVLIMTDGLVNTRNKNGERLGLKRLMDFLQFVDYNPKKILPSLIDYAECFAEGLEMREDLTLLAFRIDQPERS